MYGRRRQGAKGREVDRSFPRARRIHPTFLRTRRREAIRNCGAVKGAQRGVARVLENIRLAEGIKYNKSTNPSGFLQRYEGIGSEEIEQ